MEACRRYKPPKLGMLGVGARFESTIFSFTKGSFMSGSALTSAALDERRRRVLFRAWRRGVREMDLIMGRFADAHLLTMSEDELAEFERLLDAPDTQALTWIVGGQQPPKEFDNSLLARLRGSR